MNFNNATVPCRIAIIDDEQSGRSILSKLIENNFSQFVEIKQADSKRNGLKLIKSFEPDIVLLDVMMGDGTGFDLLEEVSQLDFRLIFITAHEQFAIKAFRYSAIDYLLKPISDELLKTAMQKCFDEINNKDLGIKLDVLFANKETVKKIAIPTQQGIEIVLIKEIIRLEADGNYTKLFLKEGSIMSSKTLKEFDQILSKSNFFRVHKSHLVSLNEVKRFLNEGGGYVVTSDGAQVEIARRRKELFLSTLVNN